MRSLVLALLLGLTGPSQAEMPVIPSPVAKVDFIHGWRGLDGVHVAALDIQLAPGWYTYWRVPGAAGLPPQFDWSGSRNLADVRHHWPRPTVFETYGQPTIGYETSLVMPVLLVPEGPDAAVEVDLRMFFGVCKDICIPMEVHLTASMRPDTPPAGRARIEAALADRGLSAEAGGVAAAVCRLGQGPKGPQITARLKMRDRPAQAPTTVIEAPGASGLWIGEAVSALSGHEVVASARVRKGDAGPILLDRSALRITLIDRDRVIEIEGCPARD